jgi:orotate phosphoribosyltransferase
MDDLITHGTSKLVFLDALTGAGVRVEDVLVILDREEGGTSVLAEHGTRLHSLITLRDLLAAYHDLNELSETQFEELRGYLDDPETWRRAHPA